MALAFPLRRATSTGAASIRHGSPQEDADTGADATNAIPNCALWQLQSVMTAAQWAQVTTAVAALNNPAVSAFFAHGTNIIPANSTTLLSIGTNHRHDGD